MPALSIVIPAYNEENGIAEIINRVLTIQDDLKKVGVDGFELLVVDDGSKDKTAEIVNGIKGVRLVQHPKNRGYGAALKTGFASAKGELIGFLDADGTYPPEFFPKLCEELLSKDYDLVVGSRMAGEKSEMPLTRRLGNVFFASLISILGQKYITDSASGMRVFKRGVLERLYPLPDGLNLTPIMTTRAIHEGMKMTEVAIPYSERIGRSKLSVVRDGTRYLKTITWTVLSYNPVSVLGLLGLIGIFFALFVGFGIVIARLTGITNLGNWGVTLLFAALVSGVLGVSLFSLGVIFNYLVSLFYKFPIRQGLFGKPIFKAPLEKQFSKIGTLVFISGLVLGIVTIIMGGAGWEITRLWFYLLASAMLILVGVQLLIYWIVILILEELSERESLANKDLNQD
jgi:glycosyltransferase involved in cell wall biosynthesis